MFKHFLVPTDGSDLSIDCLKKSASMAKEVGATVTILYVKPYESMPYLGVGAINDSHITETIKQQIDSFAKETLAAAETIMESAGVTCDSFLRQGDSPYEYVISVATEAACDLIIMASHGRKGINNILVGSETRKVLTHSKIPVLVYR